MLSFVRPSKAEFAAILAESVGYAVMECCPRCMSSIKMVPLDAVRGVLPKDQFGNAHIGDVLTTDSHNTFAHAKSRLVSLVEVKDFIVIETPGAVLVPNKWRGDDVKQIVNVLGNQRREQCALHRKIHRSWGWCDGIDKGGRFEVKRIQVKPRASLGLQKHHHQAEHWIVIKGIAEITKGNKVSRARPKSCLSNSVSVRTLDFGL